MTKTTQKMKKQKTLKNFCIMKFKLHLSFHSQRIVSLTDLVRALLSKHSYDRNTYCSITSACRSSTTCFNGEVVLSDEDVGIIESFGLTGTPFHLETITKSHPINTGTHHMLTVSATAELHEHEEPYEVDLCIVLSPNFSKIDTSR
jgi:hypothetical protein